MKPIRVLIIEDSRVVREFLEHIISNDPRLKVVGAAASAEEGIHLLHHTRPDVVSMDIRLPGMNGFEATRRIMTDCPTPIVVVSASVEADDLNITMNALKAGALAVVEKPVGTTHEDYEAMAQRLCTQLAIMSQVRVIRQRFNKPIANAPTSSTQRGAISFTQSGELDRTFRFVGLVASTGGPRALQYILSVLPHDFPVPIAIVQHITASFHAGFVRWLDSACSLTVVTAEHLQRYQPGHVYVAPPDEHLVVRADRFHLRHDELVCLERPSGSVLFESMAGTFGAESLGVLLTGMGEDGASGLAEIHNAGGYTIAEDESTAVVYGMPGAAAQLGAVRESLPLQRIAERLMRVAAQREEVA